MKYIVLGLLVFKFISILESYGKIFITHYFNLIEMDDIQKAKGLLLRICKSHIRSKEDYNKIGLAIEILIRKQGKQRRIEGVPYPLHPLQVAYNLVRNLHTNDADIIVAAILHDILEDTDIPESEIRNIFGERVLTLIKYLTNPKCPSEDKVKKREYYQQHVLKVIEKDEDAFIIKMHDLETNALSLDKFNDNPRLQKKFALKYLPLVEAFSRKAMELAIKYEKINPRYSKGLFDLSRRYKDAIGQIRAYSQQMV